MIDLELSTPEYGTQPAGQLEEIPRQNPASSLTGSREDLSHQDGNVYGSNTIDSETINLERDIVRKGIERLEKQI